MRSMTTQIFTLDTFREVRHMGKVCTLGLMENTMKESGNLGRNMGLENGKEMVGNLTLETGLKEKLMVLEHMFGKMEITMKVDGSTA